MSDSTHGTLVPLLDKPQQADESGGGGLGHETPIRQVTARTEDPIPKIVTIMSNGKRGGTEVFINGIRVTQNCESVSWSHDARGVPRVKLVMVGVQIEAIGGEAQIDHVKKSDGRCEFCGGAWPNCKVCHGNLNHHEIRSLTPEESKAAEHDPYWRPR